MRDNDRLALTNGRRSPVPWDREQLDDTGDAGSSVGSSSYTTSPEPGGQSSRNRVQRETEAAARMEDLRRRVQQAEDDAEARRVEAQTATAAAGDLRRKAARTQREATDKAAEADESRREALGKRAEAERREVEAAKCSELASHAEDEAEQQRRIAASHQDEAAKALRDASAAQAAADNARLEVERMKSELARKGAL